MLTFAERIIADFGTYELATLVKDVQNGAYLFSRTIEMPLVTNLFGLIVLGSK